MVFTSFKLNSMTSVKDMIPKGLKSSVVYKFTCDACKASYIGETTRHISTQISEHLSHDKNSHIYKHIMASKKCKALANADSFVILDHASTQHNLHKLHNLHKNNILRLPLEKSLIVQILLYRSDNYNPSMNKIIIFTVIDFIIQSKRFDDPLIK